MKHFIAIVAAAALTLPALAQVSAGPASAAPVQSTQKHKNPQAKEAKRRAVAKLDEQTRKALKLTAAAQKALSKALPIYDGHRTLALQVLRSVKVEIVMGGQQTAKAAKKGHQPKDEGHDASRLSQQELAKSQAAMATARSLVEKAISSLSASPHQGTYTAQALADLAKAKQEIVLGIALHPVQP